jgi:hypothetical protein
MAKSKAPSLGTVALIAAGILVFFVLGLKKL